MEDPGCLACALSTGERDLPGGRVFETSGWLVEHCIGPLGVGTLIVKPRRHCLHLGDLTDDEARELGPLLARAADGVRALTGADQAYACLWSHAGWKPGHLHFVVQPAWDRWRERFPAPGPTVQARMFVTNEPMPRAEIEAFCERARAWFADRAAAQAAG